MDWYSIFIFCIDHLPAPIIAILITPYIVRWWDKKFGSKKEDNSKDKES